MKKMQSILSIIFIIISIANSQTVDVEVYEPFITSYEFFYNNCIYSYEDLVVMHPEWGIVLLGLDENGDLEEISRLFTDKFYPLARQGDFLYVSDWDNSDYACDEEILIRKIDISNPEFPFIADELELDILAVGQNLLYVIDHYLFVMVDELDMYCRINLDSFSIDGNFSYYGEITRSFGDYILGYNHTDQFILYHNGADSLEIVADNFDIFAAHQQQSIHNVHQLSEDIICTIGYMNVVVWDISDLTNWMELDYWEIDDNTCINDCGYIALIGDNIYLNTWESIYALEFGLDYQISTSSVLEFPYQIRPSTIGFLENILLIPDTQGIYTVNIEENEMEWGGLFGDQPIFDNHHIIGDNYFIMSRSYHHYSGISKWNITDPVCPQPEDILLSECNYLFMRTAGNFFYLHDYWNNMWDLYHYYNNEINLLLSMPLTCNDDVFSFPFTDESDGNSLYIKNIVTNNLKKYQLNENELNLVIDSTFTNQQCGFIQNGTGYFLSQEYNHDLMIYTGFDLEQPILINQYDNIVNGEDAFIAKINNEYLAAVNCFNNIIIYGYQDTELTGQAFYLSTYRALNFQGYHDYLICFDDYNLYFYQITDETNGMIDPVQTVELIHQIVRMLYYESEEGDFLFCFGLSAVSVVEMDISDGILETEIIETPSSVKAYPNPFHFSAVEQITFELEGNFERQGKETTLSIYNIKGQLIHSEIFQPSNDKLNWDCRQDNEVKASSGVYLYKVEDNSKSEFGKFVITK